MWSYNSDPMWGLQNRSHVEIWISCGDQVCFIDPMWGLQNRSHVEIKLVSLKDYPTL
jgi:hypothetical protein